MYDSQSDVKSQLKLAQLWHLVKLSYENTKASDSYKAVVNHLLDDDFDINRRVTIRPDLSPTLTDVCLQDCTALHFVYRSVQLVGDNDTFNSLLQRGADYTLTNAKGQTVLHLIISSTDKNAHLVKTETPFAISILGAHVKHRNPSNPQDSDGLSHLHAACIFNHAEALQLFLDHGVPVNQTVNSDSKIYPGYTPLHLTALFGSIEAAQVLVSRGADVNATNAKGESPLDVCVIRQVNYLNSSRLRQVLGEQGRESYADDLRKNEKIIKLLQDFQGVSALGFSNFHIASSLTDLSIVEKLISQIEDVDHVVPKESHVFSEYTAADFALLNSVDAIKMMVTHGANLDIVRPNGPTTLDNCFKQYSSQDVYSILSCKEHWKNIYLSGSQIRLLDFLQSAASSDQLKSLLQKETENSIISGKYPSWRGNTILHLAVTISKTTKDLDGRMQVLFDKSIVEECLRVGQSINVQNLRGESAIHLAFKLAKSNIVTLLLERLDSQEAVSNLVDSDNLSYLHIACAERNESLVQKLLATSETKLVNCKAKRFLYHTYCNGTAGSTPLHLAVSSGSSVIVEMLLRGGADLHAIDSNGMSAIHCLIMRYPPGPDDRRMADVLLGSLLENPKDCVVEGIGLSYLHVACYFGNLPAVQKLLELGANINAAISQLDSSDKRILPSFIKTKCILDKYDTFTPFHMVQANPTAEMIDLLILHGVHVFAKSTTKFSRLSRCYFPLQNKFIMRRFMSILWEQEEMLKSMEQKLGLTKLHVACYLKNEQSVRSVLNEGMVDVNAQIHADSDIFAGCTPLHLLLSMSQNFAYGMIRIEANMWQQAIESFTIGPVVDLLLDRGAEVTIMNAQQSTPIHLLQKNSNFFVDANHCEDSLLKAHRNFSINPENREGMSHFHVACYLLKAELVDKFLEHGSVDVNRPIDFFANMLPGYTPLHLALIMRPNNHWPSVLHIVDSLLKHGADVSAKDVYGDTPLHQPAVLQSPELNLLDKLVSYGADINGKNVKGQIPFDKHTFNENSNDCVSLFKKYNFQINSWNSLTGEGYVGRMLSSYSQNITDRPEFKELMQSSNVRAIDEMGRTIIHNSVAVIQPFFGNNNNFSSAIEKFIARGIDIEHQDKLGQTALHYAVRVKNLPGAMALLKSGADINIVDNNGKSAFSYSVDDRDFEGFGVTIVTQRSVTESLYLYVQKLLHLGIEVNGQNRNLANTIQQFFNRMKFLTSELRGRKYTLSPAFFSQVDMSKTLTVGVGSLVLFDFLKESGAITLYPYFSIPEQTVVNDFFKNFNEKEFHELSGIVKLQFRKMTARLELIKPALDTLRTVLGFSFAGLCEEITRFLTIKDLKNLIAVAKFKDDENGKKET